MGFLLARNLSEKKTRCYPKAHQRSITFLNGCPFLHDSIELIHVILNQHISLARLPLLDRLHDFAEILIVLSYEVSLSMDVIIDDSKDQFIDGISGDARHLHMKLIVQPNNGVPA